MKGVSAVGMFVSLSSSVEARVKLGQLSDTFVEDPQTTFPAGQFVTGRILSIQGDRSVSDCSFCCAPHICMQLCTTTHTCLQLCVTSYVPALQCILLRLYTS